MEKIFKVRTVYAFEMNYLVKAESEAEARWMVENLDTHGGIEGYEYDQRGLGHVIQKVKEVSEKKSLSLIKEAGGFGDEMMAAIKDFSPWFVHYKTEEGLAEEALDMDELNEAIFDDEDDVPVAGTGKM